MRNFTEFWCLTNLNVIYGSFSYFSADNLYSRGKLCKEKRYCTFLLIHQNVENSSERNQIALSKSFYTGTLIIYEKLSEMNYDRKYHMCALLNHFYRN